MPPGIVLPTYGTRVRFVPDLPRVVSKSASEVVDTSCSHLPLPDEVEGAGRDGIFSPLEPIMPGEMPQPWSSGSLVFPLFGLSTATPSSYIGPTRPL